ncbi:hypothetical protein CXG81DRAFT_30208 [Caulochytrium protostelioides]|uniref:Aspartokinase n=1 Tax=Caulochytrium protostelioides TaxID=1555241 RepID=A0A4P9X348_9FUNG|nr:hypothetical protein CXG81DRAFT_30208 [Caulochytrium protostelioides]|eukprot:RKO99431.1 hypothetical protein CXG81DRAFT_30208 [Caulochytrium protostelioides]
MPSPSADGSDRPLYIQKYGGTSVGSPGRMGDVADIVSATHATHRVVVVLSAMSSHIKAEGTTSRLLEAAREVLQPNSSRYLDVIAAIEQSHVGALDAIAVGALETDAVRSRKQRAKDAALQDVRAECARLRSFLTAAEIIDEISPRSRDVIISVGEKLAARIFTAVLESRGIDADYIALDRLIEQPFDPRAIDQTFYDYLAQRLAAVVGPSLAAGRVPVVTGFFGPTPGGILATIGRGYTDLTAALLAVGLRASELQIWKEVDGIFSADPRKVPNAMLIPQITPEEAAELTYYGSEVIHPFTMEQAIRASVPIRIKNTFKPAGEGTGSDPASATAESPAPFTIERLPTAVTIKDGITVLNIHSNRKSVSHGFFARIFDTLDRHGVVVDLISTSEVHVSMALAPMQRDEPVHDVRAEDALAAGDDAASGVTSPGLRAAIRALRAYGTVDVIANMAILSLVGREMRNMVGNASRMFSTLAKHNINIEMISQGASEINISCVIEAKKGTVAVRAIHDECLGGEQGYR